MNNERVMQVRESSQCVPHKDLEHWLRHGPIDPNAEITECTTRAKLGDDLKGDTLRLLSACDISLSLTLSTSSNST